MRTLDAALTELSAAVPVGAEYLDALAQKLRQPPPGTIDVAELDVALAKDDLPRLALLLSILAATDFRHQGELLKRLLDWLLRQEAALDTYDRGRFQHIRGFAAWRLQEDLLTAFIALNRSIELLSTLGLPAAHAYLGRVWNSYGQIMHHQGRFEAARQDFEVALRYRERADNPADKAFTLGNLARVCIDFGDYQAAANYLAEDLAISRDLQGVPPGVEVQLLSELAHAELLLGRIDEAAEHYQRSAQLADERANCAGQIFAELGLGRVALARQPAELMAADASCRRLTGLIDGADLPQGFKTELRALSDELGGDLAATRGDWATAQAAYVKTRDHRLASPTTVPSELARILERLAQTQIALGQEMAAAMTLRTALGHLDATALDAQRKTIEELLKQRYPQIWVLHAAGRFIGQAQIDYYLSHAGQSGFLGERRTMAVLFSDIRGFTSLSESLAPEALLPLLNDFLARMTRCIEQAGGMVDKFIGDAVMAIFPDDAGANPCEQAVHAALLMDAELAHMNQHLQQPLAIGIGLHYGPMIAGLIGSPQKRSYTVIGDTVNSGSRLEGMTKLLGARILVSGDLAAGLSPGRFQLRPLGRFSPKGRLESLTVMELMGLQADGLAALERARAIQGCETYMARLEAGDLPGALAQLETLANEEPDHSRAEGYRSIAGLLRQQAAKRDPGLGVVLDFK